MTAQEQLNSLKQQLVEAWGQKAQIMDKIQSLAIAIQGAELGQQVARETAPAQASFGFDANGSPVNE